MKSLKSIDTSLHFPTLTLAVSSVRTTVLHLATPSCTTYAYRVRAFSQDHYFDIFIFLRTVPRYFETSVKGRDILKTLFSSYFCHKLRRVLNTFYISSLILFPTDKSTLPTWLYQRLFSTKFVSTSLSSFTILSSKPFSKIRRWVLYVFIAKAVNFLTWLCFKLFKTTLHFSTILNVTIANPPVFSVMTTIRQQNFQLGDSQIFLSR